MSGYRNKQALETYEQEIADLTSVARDERRQRLRELATPEPSDGKAPDSADHRESLRRLRIALQQRK